MMDAECTESGHQARAAWSTLRHCHRRWLLQVTQLSLQSPVAIRECCSALPHPIAAISPPPPLRPARGNHRPGHHWQVCCLRLLLHLLRLCCRALPHDRQVSSPHTSELPSAVPGSAAGAGARLSPWPRSAPWWPEGTGPCPHPPLPLAPTGRPVWGCAPWRRGWPASWPRWSVSWGSTTGPSPWPSSGALPCWGGCSVSCYPRPAAPTWQMTPGAATTRLRWVPGAASGVGT